MAVDTILKQLDNTQLSEMQKAELAQTLEKELNDLSVLSVTVTSNQFDILMAALKNNRTIIDLTLYGEGALEDKAVMDLAVFIPENQTVKKLTLRNIKSTTPKSRDSLNRAIKTHKNTIDFSWDSEIEQRLIETNTNKSTVDITVSKYGTYVNKIHSDKILDFLKIMEKHPSDRHKNILKEALNNFNRLSFSHKELTEADIINLSEALEANTTITELNLYGTQTRGVTTQEIMGYVRDPMSHTAAVALSNMLMKNKTIHTLDLARRMSSDSIDQIALILKNNKTLIDLDLSDNNFGDKGISLIEALKENNTLKRLGLDSTRLKIDATASEKLHDALLHNTALEILLLGNGSESDYHNFVVPSEGQSNQYTQDLEKLVSLLENNRTLTILGYPKGQDKKPARIPLLNMIKESLHRNIAFPETVQEALTPHLNPNVSNIVKEYLGLPNTSYKAFKIISNAKAIAFSADREAQAAEEANKRATTAVDSIEKRIAAITQSLAQAKEEAEKTAALAKEEARKKVEQQKVEEITKQKERVERAEQAAKRAEAAKDSQTAKVAEAEANNTSPAPLPPVVDTPVAIKPPVPADTPLPATETPAVELAKATPEVQQPETLKPEVESTQTTASPQTPTAPPQTPTAPLQATPQPTQRKKLQTAAGICVAIAVVLTPILFVLATPLAGGLVLAALLAASAVTFGLSRKADSGKSSSTTTQPEKNQPPQEAPTQKSINQQDTQSGIELNPGTPKPEDKGTKKGQGLSSR